MAANPVDDDYLTVTANGKLRAACIVFSVTTGDVTDTIAATK